MTGIIIANCKIFGISSISLYLKKWSLDMVTSGYFRYEQ